MALMHCHYFSGTLGACTAFRVILPGNTPPSDAKSADLAAFYAERPKKRVLWLLHGGGADSSDWLGHSLIQLYAEQYDIAVVMPDAQNYMYVNMAHGHKWEDHIAKGLPQYVYTNLPISSAREDNFICGCSMGGYGALRLAMRYPGSYAAAAAMGSVVGLPIKYAQGQLNQRFDAMMHAAFGEKSDVLTSDYNLQVLAEAFVKSDPKPRIKLFVGTNDHTYADNVDFKERIAGLGISYEWFTDDSTHNWDAWNGFLPRALDFMLERG